MHKLYPKVLLFSGGLDSYIAWHYLEKPQTLYFDLQNRYASVEIETVLKLVPSTIIDRSLRLKEEEEQEGMFIPMRNLYLAMKASRYSDHIYVGGVKEDRVVDNTIVALSDFQKIIREYGEMPEVTVSSPIRHMTKWELVKWYLDNVGNDSFRREILIQGSVSCYSGNQRQCGWCKSCFRKFIALAANGIQFPFHNREMLATYLHKAKVGAFIEERNNMLIKILTPLINADRY